LVKDTDNNKNTCKAKYDRLINERNSFLDRARKCSKITIPTLIPPDGHKGSDEFYTPWQSVGARGVNNLASKLLLALLPPNSPFFRLVVDDHTMEELSGGVGNRGKIEKALQKIERIIQTEIESSGSRASVFLALKHLIVGGNSLLYLPASGGMRVFPLESYVCQRDTSGNVLEVLIREKVHPETLPQDILDFLAEDTLEQPREKPLLGHEEDVELYTRFYRDGQRWRLYQEISGRIIPGSQGSWPIEKTPMLPLRWVPVEGESYGRSYVEEYLGDLVSLEGLSQAIFDAAASSSKLIFMVRPGATTHIEDLAEAESGDFVMGDHDDIKCLQAEKYADLRIANDAAKVLTERLSLAFLLNSAVQRNGERVTAEEIRYVAGELEDALGGVYTVLGADFQYPYIVREMDRLQKKKKLPALPKNAVKPQIVTGLQALGRGHDLNKLTGFMQLVSQMGPEALQMLNPGELLTRVATAMMIDPNGLIQTQEEIQQRQQAQQEQAQQAQMMDIAGKAAPSAVKAISDQMQGAQPQA